jgi:hypothetical protein
MRCQITTIHQISTVDGYIYPATAASTARLASYSLTYQWGRELLRGAPRASVAIHFRIPDDEPVVVGRYNDATPRRLTAAEAVAHFLEREDPVADVRESAIS